MCVIAATAVASFALDAGSKVMAAQAQNKEAATNKASANAAEAQGFNALSLRGTQDKQAAIGANQAADRKTTLDQSQVNLAAAENGVNGNSVAALNSELEYQKGAYHDSVAENLSNQMAQLGTEKLGIMSKTQSRINSVQPANPLATVLGIAGSAVNLGMRLKSQSPPVGG